MILLLLRFSTSMRVMPMFDVQPAFAISPGLQQDKPRLSVKNVFAYVASCAQDAKTI